MFKDGKQVFSVGDIVEITEESDATGMLDFKKGKGYVVQDFREAVAGPHTAQLYICGEGSNSEGWYSASHFKLKEDTKVEKKECLFKKGQVVWDIIYGKGVVKSYDTLNRPYPVKVVFEDDGYDYYTEDGKLELGDKSRRLFFSEPKIEAATEPVFEPVLKKGDWVVLSDATAEAIVKVEKETRTELFYDAGGAITFVNKDCVSVYRLGEKIVFN